MELRGGTLAPAPWGTDEMKTLDALRHSLTAINRSAFQGLHFDQHAIEQELKKLKGWLKDSGENSPSVDLIQESLLRFHKSGTVANLKDARLVCRGVVTPIGANQVRLIEDDKLFPKLLDCIAQYSAEPRKFRRCYRGLLSSYFSFDPDEEEGVGAERSNWMQLRSFLSEHLKTIQTDGTNPDWVGAISAHQNLLSDKPCERYGSAFLEGRKDDFEEAENHLDISGASWVGRSVVQAMVSAASHLDDDGFKHHLPELLRLLGEPRHASLVDNSLSQILDRYSQTMPMVMHLGLCNFAVEHWKNPWVNVNHARWRSVSETARKMVADWLKLDFLKQFFELLSADGSNDTRRLDFWGRYHTRIDDMYFVLGKYAMNNRAPAFVELKKKMDGRLLSLQGGGAPENNAFIMTIGDCAFVEFGTTGNAAYVYQISGGLPFDLANSKTLSAVNLKDKRSAERLMHKDNVHGYANWENRFDCHLFLTYGIRAKDDELPEPWRSGLCLSRESESTHNIEAFCRAFNFNFEDRRSAGGQLCIDTDNINKVVNRQLHNWGFGYREGRGWWRQW